MSQPEDSYTERVNSPLLSLLFYSGVHQTEHAPSPLGRAIVFTRSNSSNVNLIQNTPRHTHKLRIIKYLGTLCPSLVDIENHQSQVSF